MLTRRQLLLAPLAPASSPITLNDDGAWSWFQDERAIVDGDWLLAGSAAAGRRGDIDLTAHHLPSGKTHRETLHPALLEPRGAYDDHNAPALLVRPDGRYLAVYAKHGSENCFYYRVSERPHYPISWSPERRYIPSDSTRLTYSNVHYLSAEKKIYNFFRGLDNSYKPSYCFSDDQGETWRTGNVVIRVPATVRHRPYVKYASNGRDTIHLFYTEGHPRNFDNSVYHIYYRNGWLHRSDGTRIAPLAKGLDKPEDGTLVFKGDPNNVAWVCDIAIDSRGRPYGVYSLQKDSAGLPDGKAGMDLRYRYARWDGQRWTGEEMGHAGTRLYPGEDDYPGNLALDPVDPNLVCLSANADPLTGRRLPHYELFLARRGTPGRWTFEPLTTQSSADNIRPIMPLGSRRFLLWLRGRYTTYTNYGLAVMLQKRTGPAAGAKR